MFYYFLFIRLWFLEKYVRLLDALMLWAIDSGHVDLATKISRNLYGEGLSKNYLLSMLVAALSEGSLEKVIKILALSGEVLGDKHLNALLSANIEMGNYCEIEKIVSLLKRSLTKDERKKITEVCVEKSRFISAYQVNVPDPFELKYRIKRVFP